MKTAVAVFVYNRPDTTRQILDHLNMAKDRRLYIYGDAARDVQDHSLCEEVHRLINRFSRRADVCWIPAEKNLGLRRAILSGLHHFFQHEKSGLILEDDCHPHPNFFSFCDEALERYENEGTVGQINGESYVLGRRHAYLTSYPLCWGWATWRSRWDKFASRLPATLEPVVPFSSVNARMTGFETRFWRRRLTALEIAAQDSSWFWEWFAFSLSQAWNALHPPANLISNRGWGGSATHTVGESDLANRPMPGHALSMSDWFDQVYYSPSAQFTTFRKRLYPHGGWSGLKCRLHEQIERTKERLLMMR